MAPQSMNTFRILFFLSFPGPMDEVNRRELSFLLFFSGLSPFESKSPSIARVKIGAVLTVAESTLDLCQIAVLRPAIDKRIAEPIMPTTVPTKKGAERR